MLGVNVRSGLGSAAFGGALIALSAIAAAFVFRDGEEQQWLFATRWTARCALILFAATYLANGSEVRRRLGISFASAHFVHAVIFLIYIFAFDISRSLFSTIGGTIGYVVLALMVATTFFPIPHMATFRRWGMVYLWLVFAFSYLGRVIESGSRQGEGWFGLGVLVMIPLAKTVSRSAQVGPKGPGGGRSRPLGRR